MSEVMCHRDGVWLLINIYFIGLHLFGSLILLNFFVAVILDNLDYDDEKKKEKLEKELNKRKTEKISWKLKIFQCCGPKRIPVPNFSTNSEGPDLSESDVKKFYNTEDSAVYEQSSLNDEETYVNSNQSNWSSTRNLELSCRRTGTQSHEYRFRQVQDMLNHIKAFRQFNRETEASLRPAFDQSLSSSISKYVCTSTISCDVLLIYIMCPVLYSRNDDVNYGERYRLLDRALFCMPPDHWLRQLSKKILTTKMETPNSVLATDSVPFWTRSLRRIAYLLR